MRRLAPALAFVAALVAGLLPLLLLDGGRRAWGFRVYALALGVVAIRSLLRFVEATSAPPEASPFRRRSRLLAAAARWIRGRRHTPAHHRGSAALVRSATASAGGLHHRLRPVLRTIADERLRAGRGFGVDDDHARAVLSPASFDLLRADRPSPDDRRGPGAPLTTITAVLDDLESL